MYIRCKTIFFFVYVDVLSKSKKEIIKNNIIENDFFPCKQSSTQNMYMQLELNVTREREIIHVY